MSGNIAEVFLVVADRLAVDIGTVAGEDSRYRYCMRSQISLQQADSSPRTSIQSAVHS